MGNGKSDQDECSQEFQGPGLKLQLLIKRGNASAAKEADFSCWFGKEFWGQGFGTEASTCLLDHVFQNLNVSVVRSCTLADNDRALRLLTKLGFDSGIRTIE